MQTPGVVIRYTPGVSVSKKKAQAKVDRGKGMDLFSDVALLEAAQLKKVLMKGKQDTYMIHVSGSDDGVGSKPKVTNELKEKITGINEGTDSGDDDDSNDDDNDDDDSDDDGNNVESNEDHELMMTEKSIDEEEEKQDDDLKIVEPADKEKCDVEMINTKIGDDELENVNHECAGQVNDYSQATQKTEVSIIPKHAFVNPPEVVTTASSATISSLLSSLFPHLQQLAPILTPTTTKATTTTMTVSKSKTLATFHQRITNLEKDVKELKTIDHSVALFSTIKSEVINTIKECLGTSLDDALYKRYVDNKSTKDIRKIKMEHARQQQEPEETITSSNTTTLEEFNHKTTLFETMTKSKSFNKSPKQRALYHALMESILEDEDAMDEGIADELKKRKQDDADKDEGPFRKSTIKSAQADETVFEARDTQEPQNQGQDVGNTDDHPNVKAAPKHDWFKKLERTLTLDSEWNVRKSIDFRPPQTWISKVAQVEKSPISFDELMSTPINFSACVMNHLKIDKLTQEHLEYPFYLSKPLPLIMVRGHQVILVDYFINNDLEYLRGGSSSKKYTTSTTKTKATKYDILGIEDMVPSNPQGNIYVDKYNRDRLMRSVELYKFSDGTLTSVRTVLHEIASNLRMDYLPKRRWSDLDRQRSRIMIKAIDKLLLERRLMRILEKFVGGRDYGEDFRLVERII
nr:hypothetical protein [Tanacetum cinerariifolium]